jgi:uncharacterized membrane protein (DUF106 family)
MARIEEKVRDLVADDPSMREAVETVLDRAASNGEVGWVDVKGDVESGQWGRLIEKGVLVEGDSGFRLADEEATRAGLESKGGEYTESSVNLDDVEETTWSKWDKLAGLSVLLFFVGYSYGPVRNVIGGAVDLALGPFMDMLPFYAVVMLIAMATGFYTTVLRGMLMDMDKMAMYQERMKDIQDRRKEAKEAGDDDAMQAIQEEQMEAMGDQMGMFKEQFRPMAWIMFLTIPAFLWMYWAIGVGANNTAHYELANIVLPFRGSVSWTEGVLGPIQVWIVWYFVCSMAFTQVIQKALNIEMTPSTS